MGKDRLIEDKIIKTGKVNWRRFEFLQKESFKEITKKQMDKLKASILNNDFIETFKCWQNDGKVYCLDGYHRCLALSELAAEGYQVPDEFTANFVQCKDMKDAAKKVLVYSSIYASVTDEGLYEFSHDFNLNFDEIKFEIDIPKLDLDRYEAGYVRDDDYNEEEDNVPEPPAEPTTKVGDLYLLGRKHRLLCGDSTKAEDVARLMDGKKADMVFTDPPYGMNLDTDFSKMSGNGRTGKEWDRVIGDDSDFNPLQLMQYCDYVSEQFWWGADYYCERIPNKNSGAFIVWDKTLNSNGDAGYNSEFEICWSKQPHKREVIHFNWFRYFGLNSQDNSTRLHPTQKPLEVIKPILNKYGKDGDVVIDFFGGSGSTLIACEQTNRVCFMSEISPHYCDVIINRYKNLTGKDVELIESMGGAANE